MNRARGGAVPQILHLQSTFAAGGKELRTVQLINAFGKKARHTIVSAEPDRLGAAERIAKSIDARIQPDFPSLKGRPTPGRLQKLAKAMKGFDLVCTYNWGAMDAVMAHTLFKDLHNLPPLIHHEDGFDESELKKLKTGRTWYRRIALGKAAGLVVPSERLEEIALVDWQQPLGRVKRIPNGIDTKAFAMRPKRDALRLIKHPGELWVGTLAGLRTVKNLPRLVRVFSQLADNWQLVILGEGDARDAILAEADRLEINHRVHLPGAVDDPARVIGLFDIFALSSDSEQFPLSVVEAMAAGLPVVAPAVGDIASMVAEPNAEFVTPPGNEEELGIALVQLAVSKDLRKEVGEANRAKAVAEFDEAKMISTYRRLYSSAMRIEL
ncbi:glycosyltransferase family 4 protein [Erythrobacter sp.]|uniref:glycosyltransferase family 4 protein n=1 Tax=Erythrobacter sp. TaxID=1042 RepID=UPI001B1D220E|nr:glycosyltransferase family 4 protein [Erythrobacter sp.]MBO6527042.1 glycosyltransferase family 4 protein [Erythrobacter sp.]MBO6528922.1 glycosyltransferase family 4 protein [Erythrobacter sp.]